MFNENYDVRSKGALSFLRLSLHVLHIETEAYTTQLPSSTSHDSPCPLSTAQSAESKVNEEHV